MTVVPPRRKPSSQGDLFINYTASVLIAAALTICALSSKSTETEGRKTVSLAP
jgi:hypothetical protein